jgi:long-chain acyl-CoA synthetase
VSTQVDVFRESAEKYPKNVALQYFDRSISYEEMNSLVNGLARHLGKFVKKGDVIAVSLQNVPQFVLLEYAAWKLGCIFLPLNPMYKERELEFLLKDADVALIVCLCESSETVLRASRNSGIKATVLKTSAQTFNRVPQDLASKWKIEDGKEELSLDGSADSPRNSAERSDPALLVYTSGTTGKPKGAIIRHANILASSSIYRRLVSNHSRRQNTGCGAFLPRNRTCLSYIRGNHVSCVNLHVLQIRS